MVMLHVKTADEKNQFLFETQTQTSVAALQNELVQIHNLRVKVLQLCDACRGLAAHGPLRPEATRGLTEEVAKISELDIYADGEPTNPDPTDYRTGVAPSPETAKVLETTADSSAEAVSHKKVLMNQPLTLRQAKAAFENLRGAVMIAYPAFYKLPEWDPARVILDEDEQQKEESAIVTDILHPDKTALWWAGKELSPSAVLSSYIGKNEKTKIVARLQPKGAGAPIREPRVDAETHKAMLAYCHRKRQEAEEAEEDDDDSYLDSSWANPRALKNMLVGGGREIKWRP